MSNKKSYAELKALEMSMENETTVWVFMGCKAYHPSAVFADKSAAEAWINKNSLTGTLTEYPVGIGAYDWALKHDCFTPKSDKQSSPKFIASFTSEHQSHFHYGDEWDD